MNAEHVLIRKWLILPLLHNDLFENIELSDDNIELSDDHMSERMIW